MERVTMYKVSGGNTFATESEARQYCENRMGNIISLRAGQLAQIDKYSVAIEFIETHLADFAEARRWQLESQESLTFDY